MDPIPVIIPFYKKQVQLDRCIQHLQAQSRQVEIFVRDNTDDNIYFTAAINEGLLHFAEHPSPYRLVMNQDLYLKEDALEQLVEFMDETPRCGIAAPLQLDPEDESHATCGGTLNAWPLGKHLAGPANKFSEPNQYHWANGACLLLRKTMIQEIGILDKNMQFIGSDADYCFHARSRGWQVWLVPTARALHGHGASSHTKNLEIELIKANDMIYFTQKWLTGELYCGISLEGPELTQEKLQAGYERFLNAREQLTKALT